MAVTLIILALVVRIANLTNSPMFADMEWFFASAQTAIETGQLPLLGITTSITWLHQGPLWTYLLLLPTALHIPALIFTILGGLLTILLVYFSTGLVAATIIALLPFVITNDLTVYHTTPIPFFFFLTYALLLKRRSFLAGLFMGFLYQLHLLTFIYWPLWLYLAYKNKLGFGAWGLGFVIGILPFILSGPVQTLGIFIWLGKQLLTGFSSVSSEVSTAYQVVLLPGAILLIGWVVKWLYAVWHRHYQK